MSSARQQAGRVVVQVEADAMARQAAWEAGMAEPETVTRDGLMRLVAAAISTVQLSRTDDVPGAEVAYQELVAAVAALTGEEQT